MEPGAVYWVGQDGNVWFKSSSGVKNMGAATSAQNDGFDARLGSAVASRIADPNAPSAPVAPSGGGGGGGGTGKVLNQAGIDNTQRTIDEIPGLLEAALRAEKQRYRNTIGEFDEQEQGQKKTYDGSTVTNQQNYDGNYMDSIRAGIKGLGGLMSILRGTGAGGGTAEEIARDTVGEVTSKDIRTGADTRDENQTALDSSWSNFQTEINRKRAMNEDAFENNERAVRRETDTQLQDLFGRMAGYYGDVGDETNANSWMNRAGDLTPRIARNSRTQVSAYDTAPVVVKAPELSAFAAPSQPSVVTAPGGEVGSGIFTMGDTRRRREPVAAGA